MLFFYKKIDQLNFKLINNSSEKYFYYIYLIIIIYLFLKLSIYPRTTYLSLVFIICNLVLLNFIFYKITKIEN